MGVITLVIPGHPWITEKTIRLSSSKGLFNNPPVTDIQACGSPGSLAGTLLDGHVHESTENLSVFLTTTPNSSQSLSENSKCFPKKMEIPKALPLYVRDGIRELKSSTLGLKITYLLAKQRATKPLEKQASSEC